MKTVKRNYTITLARGGEKLAEDEVRLQQLDLFAPPLTDAEHAAKLEALAERREQMEKRADRAWKRMTEPYT